MGGGVGPAGWEGRSGAGGLLHRPKSTTVISSRAGILCEPCGSAGALPSAGKELNK